ncbi:periplasmic heavy metal sensor [Falsirhodobacter sp. alg1]|uniref:periplasmic heavy metal sensor n=1 Tax=Falsirhodobacter sp. alg1 TaxID=1472418 RepID=UPI00078906CC|nr:periplasmic heavy metal sensor [Falsirhodobacter sp. alg1]
MILRLHSRTLRIALAVSVALNLAVAGIVAGAVLRDPPRRDGERSFVFGPFDAALSVDDRRAIRNAFRAQKPELRTAMTDMQKEMEQISAILRTEPYDAAAIDKIFARQQARGAWIMGQGQRLLSERLAAMTPEERADFADRLEAGRKQPAPPPRR